MDERKTVIKELEEKRRAETEARNRQLEGLGEALIQRIGEEDTFPGDAGEILTEYRGLRKEIADSTETIKRLEVDMLKLKELEDDISAQEVEISRLTKGLEEACACLGKVLLAAPGFDEFAASYRQQEEVLLAKIDEQEQKSRELEERAGGVLVWLGKNAQKAVCKTILIKNCSSLQRLYRSVGEQFFASRPAEAPEGQVAEAVRKVEDMKERLSSLNAELSALRGERRKIGDTFGVDGSPSRRINGLQKRIAFVNEEFPALYLRLGSFAATSKGQEVFSSAKKEEDKLVLERVDVLQSMIDTEELRIKKLKAAINIDSEKAEVEKIKRSISNQQQKIAAANAEIADLEKEIDELEKHIEELKAILLAE